MWSKIKSPRARSRGGGTSGYLLANETADTMDEISIVQNDLDRENQQKMFFPPRYRFRDLILGDFAFNDDGER